MRLTKPQRRAYELIQRNQPIAEHLVYDGLRVRPETLAKLREHGLVTRTQSGLYCATSLPLPTQNRAAMQLGRRGGKVGGRARADKLTPERRSEIARLAAKTRWENR